MSLLRPTPNEASASGIDERALEEFAERHGGARFAPVCVVIPAFEEEGTIAAVIDDVPQRVCGLATTTLVVVDGGADATASVSESHGALACVCAVNRGQGAALRLGYRIARERGSSYIVVVDADGQWDPREAERLLGPLVEGRADFTQGSRALGEAANDDQVRRAGVVVFASLVSILTHTRVTDTSSGLRAMRAELTGQVLLEQEQYQASELLISMLAQGARLVEVPVVMRKRAVGQSKKGGNLAYGARYGKVVLRTWWRERDRLRRR